MGGLVTFSFWLINKRSGKYFTNGPDLKKKKVPRLGNGFLPTLTRTASLMYIRFKITRVLNDVSYFTPFTAARLDLSTATARKDSHHIIRTVLWLKENFVLIDMMTFFLTRRCWCKMHEAYVIFVKTKNDFVVWWIDWLIDLNSWIIHAKTNSRHWWMNVTLIILKREKPTTPVLVSFRARWHFVL